MPAIPAQIGTLEIWANGIPLHEAGEEPVRLPHDSYVTLNIRFRNDRPAPLRADLEVRYDNRVVVGRRTRRLEPAGTVTATVGVGRLSGTHRILATVTAVLPDDEEPNQARETGFALAADGLTPALPQQRRRRHGPTGPWQADTDTLAALNWVLVEQILLALERAVHEHEPYRRLLSEIEAVAPAVTWTRSLVWDLPIGIAKIRDELERARVRSDQPLRRALDELVCRLGPPVFETRRADEIELCPELSTGGWWSWWDPQTLTLQGSDEGTGRIVVIRADGLSVGDHTRQHNVFLHVVEAPSIDFGRILGNPAVAAALAAVATYPHDLDARRLAVAAVSQVRPRDTSDWTSTYSSVGSVTTSSSAATLDGTIAIVKSRGVQVGDRVHQENTFVAALTPSLDSAALLAGNGSLVNALIDLVTSDAGGREMASFEAALNRDLTADMASSEVLQGRRGFVARPPQSGRTLRAVDTQGTAIGHHVIQRNTVRQHADLERSVLGDIKRDATVAHRRVRRAAEAARRKAEHEQLQIEQQKRVSRHDPNSPPPRPGPLDPDSGLSR